MIVLVFAAVFSSVFAAPRVIDDGRWEEWRSKFEKRYPNEEVELLRRAAWQNSLALMNDINNRNDVSFKVEMNVFADRMLQGRKKLELPKRDGPWHTADSDSQDPPASFDWRKKGVISPVQNQGALGSPVAIAGEECVQSLGAIKTGKLSELSLAEIVDCCETHILNNIFICIANIGGLCTTADYPRAKGHCANTTCQAAVKIDGGRAVPPNRVDLMVDALLAQPLLVAIDADTPSFELYKGGIYSDPDCSTTNLDHALQVVGYGQEGGQDYWICKNSWGSDWGENGYIRIKKGVNMCGIESFAMYPF